MFTWYPDSSLTIVFRPDVGKCAKPGDLQRSIGNTRAWTFQEYLASKAIQFYAEDWTPYPDPDRDGEGSTRETTLEEAVYSLLPVGIFSVPFTVITS